MTTNDRQGVMPHQGSFTLGEEIANAITHGAGLVASVLAIPVLVGAAWAGHDPARIASAIVFAGALVALYGASTLYHALPPSRAKQLFQLVDHSAIFLLIAGTYTPFAIGVLRGIEGWTVLGLIWTLALAGIAGKSMGRLRSRRLSTLLYVGMGWLAVLILHPLAASLSAAGLGWLVAGGLFYTAGVLFYVRERPRYSHTIWHLFVLSGSACHFMAVLWYALPPTG